MSIEVFALPDNLPESDVFVFSVGYESRSLYILSQLEHTASIKLAYSFDSPDELSRANRAKLIGMAGCDIIDSRSRLHKEISDRCPNPGRKPLRITVDISSMSRRMMARVVSQLLDDDYFKGPIYLASHALSVIWGPSSRRDAGGLPRSHHFTKISHSIHHALSLGGNRMPLYLVSYDLRRRKDYKTLWDAMDELGGHKPLQSVYLLNVNSKTASDLRDYLKNFIDDDDQLLVVEFNKRPAHQKANQGTNKWIEDKC